jgi:dihydrolipoamide dehydrogenase
MDVTVPDIGDFTDVPVIEVLVAEGDEVTPEQPLVTLESDKASMDVPAPEGGTVIKIAVSVGDKVSEGSLLLVLEPSGAKPEGGDSYVGDAPEKDTPARVTEEPAPQPSELPEADVTCQVLVLGAGPGGYTAAFRAADLGLKTVMVERYASLGGVCLNVGCIPSKALLHAAKVVADAEEQPGLSFGEPQLDLDALRAWKDDVVGKLTGGLAGMSKRRDVQVVQGSARFTGPHAVEVDGTTIAFEHCIVAVGSRPAWLPFLPEDDPRIMSSTGALALEDVPRRLLVIGGGIIGLEMATVYEALGSEVTIVELTDGLIPGCDRDLVKPLQDRMAKRWTAIHTGTGVTAVEVGTEALRVVFGDGGPEPVEVDRILVAVGRRPNGADIGAEAAGVEVDDRGFIRVDEQLRTNVPHVFAIGDVVGDPMLAHKAMHEGKVAAEVIAGHDVSFDAKTIPAVAYTDPEVAWAGLTETQAKADGTPYEKAAFPWAASGRALSMGRPSGTTKLLLDPETRHVLGGGVVGAGAGELIAEIAHAIEMGATAEDLALTVHPHPTLSETVGLAAEVAEGTVTDLPPQRRR